MQGDYPRFNTTYKQKLQNLRRNPVVPIRDVSPFVTWWMDA
jgi:hypothetical protein